MEITFYNKTGHPQTYLSVDNDNSFYTWEGHAVAYLFVDKVYGWKGKHIGWYSDGIIYDIHGYRVGSVKEKCSFTVLSEYSKYSKFSRYSRYSRYTPFTKPVFSSSYAQTDLIDFITQDRA